MRCLEISPLYWLPDSCSNFQNQDAGQPIFVIADNARCHHRIKIGAFLDTQQGKIMMGFLPAYFPALNPDEQAWNHAKAEVSKCPITST